MAVGDTGRKEVRRISSRMKEKIGRKINMTIQDSMEWKEKDGI